MLPACSIPVHPLDTATHAMAYLYDRHGFVQSIFLMKGAFMRKAPTVGHTGRRKILFVAGVLTYMSSFTVEAAHAQVGFDYAIRSVVENLSASLETGARIAVASIQADTDRMSRHLIHGLVDGFGDIGRFVVLTRSEAELILAGAEIDINMSYMFDEHTAQFIGRHLGAQFIVTGTFESFAGAFRFRGVVIEVEPAIIRASFTRIVQSDRAIRYLLGYVDSARLWSVGVSAGTSFADPWVVGTVWATLAPLRWSFVRVGLDIGFVSSRVNVEGYYSIFPFVHYALFVPFYDLPIPFAMGGWHIGAGAGFMIEEHSFAHFALRGRAFMADFVTGFNVGNMLDISYTLRTDFSSLRQKVSVGVTHRFQ